MIAPGPRSRSRRRRLAGSRSARWLVGLALGAILFGVGVAVGEALHDNPKPGIVVTKQRTLHP